MCTDLRFMRLHQRHVSARTYDWVAAAEVKVRIVPRGRQWVAVPAEDVAEPLGGTTGWGYVWVVDDLSPDWAVCDGLNEAGLSVANLELAETELPRAPSPADDRQVDLLSLTSYLLGTCATVADLRAALDGVQVWAATGRASVARRRAAASGARRLRVHRAPRHPRRQRRRPRGRVRGWSRGAA